MRLIRPKKTFWKKIKKASYQEGYVGLTYDLDEMKWKTG